MHTYIALKLQIVKTYHRCVYWSNLSWYILGLSIVGFVQGFLFGCFIFLVIRSIVGKHFTVMLKKMRDYASTLNGYGDLKFQVTATGKGPWDTTPLRRKPSFCDRLNPAWIGGSNFPRLVVTSKKGKITPIVKHVVAVPAESPPVTTPKPLVPTQSQIGAMLPSQEEIGHPTKQPLVPSQSQIGAMLPSQDEIVNMLDTAYNNTIDVLQLGNSTIEHSERPIDTTIPVAQVL